MSSYACVMLKNGRRHISMNDFHAHLTKPINYDSLEVDGIDTRDYPDFCDAYFSHGEYEDGEEMSDEALQDLTEKNPNLLHAKINDALY
jgi:hypothetical protein